jgi:glycine cleavage system aminomethyltransferase T
MSNIKIQGNASGTGTTTLQSPNTSSSLTLTLPAADGTSGQALVTDGSGNLTFATAGITTGKSIAMAMIFGF